MASPALPRGRWFLPTLLVLSIALTILSSILLRGRSPTPTSRTSIAAEFEHGDQLPNPAFPYTPPRRLDRLATEWEPQEALILSLSMLEARASEDIATYMIDLLDAAHDYVDIYLFCEHEEDRAYAHFLSRLNDHPRADDILARTEFVDSRELMRWIRDFGPLFAHDHTGGLVAIDPVYRDLRRDLQNSARGDTDQRRRFMALQGDAMPSDVAAFLQRRFEQDVEVVRPPLWMEGGDFIHDGRGHVFISTQTLARNGGAKPALSRLFTEYFGTTELHVLETLPGATVSHLDMVLKFVSPTTALIPDYRPPAEPPLNRYRRELHHRAQSVLDRNEAYLRRHFPEVRLIKVPMPPLAFKSRAAVHQEAVQEFLQAMLLNRNLVRAEDLPQLTPARWVELERQVLTLIRRETGVTDLSSEGGFDRVVQHYGQMPLARYYAEHSEPVTPYRSYLNSLFLHAPDGRHAFLVPRFTSDDPAEAARLRQWEEATAAAYHQAWPQAEIRWINCDAMILDQGFIHCTSLTLPVMPRP